MKWYRVARGLKFVLFAALAVVVFSFAVMSLWNWLMPAIFGANPITFRQAVGLLLLSRILFGRFGGGPGRRIDWRRRMMERWNKMTPEERERFSKGMTGRCGGWEAPFREPREPRKPAA